MSNLNIVVLDGKYANPGDLSWDGLKPYGRLTVYEQTSTDQVLSRAKNANIIITNKVIIGKTEFESLPYLKFIVISATGMNNVDLEEAAKHNIPVKNVGGYSTHSVAQHTWAMILELTNQISAHNQSVKAGNWNAESGFSFTKAVIPELFGMKLGIYGLGEIGKSVAHIGAAFGMDILVTSNHAQPADYPNYEFVSIKELFEKSDIISLHAPLRASNKKIVDSKLLSLMKPTAYLVNTARGQLVDETDLHEVLSQNLIKGAALDVLSTEPPETFHPLFGLENCIITPHMAWTTANARSILIDEVINHVAGFQKNQA